MAATGPPDPPGGGDMGFFSDAASDMKLDPTALAKRKSPLIASQSAKAETLQSRARGMQERKRKRDEVHEVLNQWTGGGGFTQDPPWNVQLAMEVNRPPPIQANEDNQWMRRNSMQTSIWMRPFNARISDDAPLLHLSTLGVDQQRPTDAREGARGRFGRGYEWWTEKDKKGFSDYHWSDSMD